MAAKHVHGLQSLRWFAILIACCASGLTIARAEEPIERKLLHQDAAFVLELQHPMHWGKHPLIRKVWESLWQSPQVQAGLATPEFGRVTAAKEFLETASGRDWQSTLTDLTAGGIWLAVTPQPEERATLIITAKDAGSWNTIEAAIVKQLEEKSTPRPDIEIYREMKTYRIAKTVVAIIGSRCVVTSHETEMKRIIDGLVDHAGAESSEDKASPALPPSIAWDIDLEVLRQVPGLRKPLRRPAEDAGQIALLGGWFDLLNSDGRLQGKLHWPQNTTDIGLTLTITNIEPGEASAGFFATEPDHTLAPLLQPPGTIYSASWFRDYRDLWKQRGKLLTEPALAKLEKGDQDVKQQFSVFGTSYLPSDFFQQLGPRFRFVVVRGGESEYRVPLKARLPAAAICASLRDEAAFLTQAEPLFRAVGLVAAFGKAKMLSKTSKHGDAELKGLWFRDDEQSAEQGNRLRFNFNPTWTVARGHLILGSTRQVVTQVIDELDRQAIDPSHDSATASAGEIITDRQRLSFADLAAALTDFRETILHGSALERGLRLGDAVTELELATQVISSLGQLGTQAAFTDQGFEYQVLLRSTPQQIKP